MAVRIIGGIRCGRCQVSVQGIAMPGKESLKGPATDRRMCGTDPFPTIGGLVRSDEADSAELRAAIIVAEKECCVIPQGLPGTAVRGPACTVVWEHGGETSGRLD